MIIMAHRHTAGQYSVVDPNPTAVSKTSIVLRARWTVVLTEVILGSCGGAPL